MYSSLTNTYYKIQQAIYESKDIDTLFVQGGTQASKTVSIIQFFLILLNYITTPKLLSIVAETIPHLERGAIRDFKNILGVAFDESQYNETKKIYQYGAHTIEFFSAEDYKKVLGLKRDFLFINEVNNIPYETFYNLYMRTKYLTIADFNPTNYFYAHDLSLQKGKKLIKVTYKDNQYVGDIVKERLEKTKELDVNWYNVYVSGEVGKIENLVYPQFETIEDIEYDKITAEKIYGLDWGYTDPLALVECKISEDNLYLKEIIYESKLTNEMLLFKLNNLDVDKRCIIFADCEDPKSIDFLLQNGFNVVACTKKDISFGVKLVNTYKKYWTKTSINGIKEQKNYMFIKNHLGQLTDKTTHIFSHLMDAMRYAVVGYNEVYNKVIGVFTV